MSRALVGVQKGEVVDPELEELLSSVFSVFPVALVLFNLAPRARTVRGEIRGRQTGAGSARETLRTGRMANGEMRALRVYRTRTQGI
jgi:hypothetical protein